MFERRLKVFLLILCIVTSVLVARAVQLQIVEHAQWTQEAIKSLHHATPTDTTRGRLLDVKGRVLAEDDYCFDACVDYRAIVRDPDPDWMHKPNPDWVHDPSRAWVHEIAVARVKARDAIAHEKSVSKTEQIKNEIVQVYADIDAMWVRLARDGGMSADQMDDLRKSIIDDVEARRHYLWYERDRQQQEGPTTSTATTQAVAQGTAVPWYLKWMPGHADAAPVDAIDDIKIDEQTQPHVILRSITAETYNSLGKEQERFPGLVLRPGMERKYPLPYALAACHVLGRMDRVNPSDLENDPWAGDDLRKYGKSDLIGREGLERLCEPLLRGTRGQIEEWSGDESGGTISTEKILDAVPGQDVRTTIDVDLEQDIRGAFDHVNVKREKTDPDIFADMHGAAVVIDVPTGEVRAMVSAPGFDPNEWEQNYTLWKNDDLNQPLSNRATREPRVTGSTIKPVVGIGAITQGVMGINETINCDGFLWLNGRKMPSGRCWTMSEFGMPGHVIPLEDPHPGPLAFPDALQRSCNVFFENMGYRLHVEGLAYWMRTFGLGRMTGVGIAELPGRLPDEIPRDRIADRNSAALQSAIGQGHIEATPIQMANVAATIARNGIWMRPRLVNDNIGRQLRAIIAQQPSTQPSWTDLPDEGVDLKLSPQAVAAAQEGMFRVVNTIAGTGTALFRPDLEISGKTGTAQAEPFSIPVRDKFGKEIIEGSKHKRLYPDPSTPDHPNPNAPWYLGFPDTTGPPGKTVTTIQLQHAWYIGYAPSRNPRIAFAVLVEYGGSGGLRAGSIAQHIIDECIKRGYVSTDTQMRTLVP